MEAGSKMNKLIEQKFIQKINKPKYLVLVIPFTQIRYEFERTTHPNLATSTN
jgi:hypothetical protein